MSDATSFWISFCAVRNTDSILGTVLDRSCLRFLLMETRTSSGRLT